MKPQSPALKCNNTECFYIINRKHKQRRRSSLTSALTEEERSFFAILFSSVTINLVLEVVFGWKALVRLKILEIVVNSITCNSDWHYFQKYSGSGR